jgi:nucleoside 2-deoxyribosyltransferase
MRTLAGAIVWLSAAPQCGTEEEENRVQIYLAARYSRHPEMQLHARRLEKAGHHITSRWIWGGHEATARDEAAQKCERMQFALDDIHDLRISDCIMMFQEAPRLDNVRGGAFVELGIAIERGLIVIIVGKPGHVFAALPRVEVAPDFEAAEALIAKGYTECLK